MERFYSTSQIAEIFDLHPNTIRLYESWGFISTAERKQNDYRVFTDEHIKQIEIVRLALKAEVLQNGLRKQAIQIIKTVAKRDYREASHLADKYIADIEKEIKFSEEAVAITENILSNKIIELIPVSYTRQKAANYLQITIDTLRNWEMNGLLKVKRESNGYRVYNEADMQTLKIIRVLRVGNYSLSAILRMMNALHKNQIVDLNKVLNTPDDGEFIISVCDKLIVSLRQLSMDANVLKEKISVLA